MRESKLLACIFLIAISSLILPATFVSAAEQERNLDATIEAMVESIRTEPDFASRIGAARELSIFIRKQIRERLDGLSEKSVIAIASLLNDRLDQVKSYAATALGDIGPAARSALPALKSALRDVEPAFESPIIGKIGVSSTAAPEILEALRRIAPNERNRMR